MEIGIWRGFLNTISTFTGSAKIKEEKKKENSIMYRHNNKANYIKYADLL